MKQPKFELFKGRNEKYYFRLKAANGEPILASRAYRSKTGAMHGIASVMENASVDERFFVRVSSDLKYYFVLRSKGGQTIGWSELYQSKQGRNHGIDAVQRAVRVGRVFDLSV